MAFYIRGISEEIIGSDLDYNPFRHTLHEMDNLSQCHKQFTQRTNSQIYIRMIGPLQEKGDQSHTEFTFIHNKTVHTHSTIWNIDSTMSEGLDEENSVTLNGAQRVTISESSGSSHSAGSGRNDQNIHKND